jgi:putative molybdopterin biosynthesis protein
MEGKILYQQIAEMIRMDILERRIEPGGRLPTVRELTARWNCTPGTVQRAYRELANQGLVTSRPGMGTRVSDAGDDQRSAQMIHSLHSLRKASLVNHAEGFLLELLTAGNQLEDIERAFRMAADRWRALESEAEPARVNTLRIGGSHDPLLTAVVSQMAEILPEMAFEIRFNGSLGGIMALVEGKVDLAGCHLWDRETEMYNLPFVQRMLPGRRAAIIHLARRRIGLILPPGNPDGIGSLEDLCRPGVRFANRQAGSGTRVWLDAQLAAKSIDSKMIDGYGDEYRTHSEVSRVVAEGKAQVGLGLEFSARELGLDFLFLTEERYDLVCLEAQLQETALRQMLEWLKSPAAAVMSGQYQGYDGRDCGQVTFL